MSWTPNQSLHPMAVACRSFVGYVPPAAAAGELYRSAYILHTSLFHLPSSFTNGPLTTAVQRPARCHYQTQRRHNRIPRPANVPNLARNCGNPSHYLPVRPPQA